MTPRRQTSAQWAMRERVLAYITEFCGRCGYKPDVPRDRRGGGAEIRRDGEPLCALADGRGADGRGAAGARRRQAAHADHRDARRRRAHRDHTAARLSGAGRRREGISGLLHDQAADGAGGAGV